MNDEQLQECEADALSGLEQPFFHPADGVQMQRIVALVAEVRTRDARIAELEVALKPFAEAWKRHDPDNPLSAPHGSINSEAFESAARVLKDSR